MTIFQNGSITITNDNQETLGHNDYCLSNVISDDKTMMGTFAYKCFYEATTDTRSVVNFFGRLIE